mmetsp:Transcript_37130/g.113968  ORF Transcript_37130/g.113968 Transcript_37130/m.113968 type:complete len:214 (+) Transcript_37130:55-696(+)
MAYRTLRTDHSRALSLPVQLDVHHEVGLVWPVRVAVDVFEALERALTHVARPHLPRRDGPKAAAALLVLQPRQRASESLVRERGGDDGAPDAAWQHRRHAAAARDRLLEARDGRAVAKRPRIRLLPLGCRIDLGAVPRTRRRHDVIDHDAARRLRRRAAADLCVRPLQTIRRRGELERRRCRHRRWSWPHRRAGRERCREQKPAAEDRRGVHQ